MPHSSKTLEFFYKHIRMQSKITYYQQQMFLKIGEIALHFKIGRRQFIRFLYFHGTHQNITIYFLR